MLSLGRPGYLKLLLECTTLQLELEVCSHCQDFTKIFTNEMEENDLEAVGSSTRSSSGRSSRRAYFGDWPHESGHRRLHCIRFYRACGITLDPHSSIPLVPQIRAAQVSQRSTSKDAFGLKVLSLKRYEERVAILQAYHQGGVARSTLVREYDASVYKTIQVYQLGEDDPTNPDPLSSTNALMRRTTKGLFRVVHSANVFDVLCEIHYEEDTAWSSSLTRHAVRIQQLYITDRLIKRFVATSPHVTDDRCGPSRAPANSLLGQASLLGPPHGTGQPTLHDKRLAAASTLVRPTRELALHSAHNQEKDAHAQRTGMLASETTVAEPETATVAAAAHSLVTPPTATRTMVQTTLSTRKGNSNHHQSEQHAIATTTNMMAEPAATQPIHHGVDPAGRKLNARQFPALDFVGGPDPEGNERFTNTDSASHRPKSPPGTTTTTAEARGRSREPASNSEGDDNGLWTFQPFSRSIGTKSTPAKQQSSDSTTDPVVAKTLAQKRSRTDPTYPCPTIERSTVKHMTLVGCSSPFPCCR
jgi:hypothetical protein